MSTLAKIRERFDRERVHAMVGRLWSLVGAGVASTLVSFAGVYLADWQAWPLCKAIFTLFGCVALCVTIFLVVLFSFLTALGITIYETRHRFRRVLGAWLFNGPFIASVLFMGYQIVRTVLLPR